MKWNQPNNNSEFEYGNASKLKVCIAPLGLCKVMNAYILQRDIMKCKPSNTIIILNIRSFIIMGRA